MIQPWPASSQLAIPDPGPDGFGLNVSLENRPAVGSLSKPSRRDAGDPLKMKAKVALIREAREERNLG
jgi:hypothetical protein